MFSYSRNYLHHRFRIPCKTFYGHYCIRPTYDSRVLKVPLFRLVSVMTSERGIITPNATIAFMRTTNWIFSFEIVWVSLPVHIAFQHPQESKSERIIMSVRLSINLIIKEYYTVLTAWHYLKFRVFVNDSYKENNWIHNSQCEWIVVTCGWFVA